MFARCKDSWLVNLVLLLVILALVPTSLVWAQVETTRSSWLLDRGVSSDYALTGQRFEQSEIGGGGDSDEIVLVDSVSESSDGASGWPILMSLVLPGAGEAYLGYRRGYAMAAVDIFAWTQVSKYNGEGDDIKDEYIAFADAHYSDELLVAGYYPGGDPFDGGYRNTPGILIAGGGDQYFPSVGPIYAVDELGALPLYVTKDEDFREYYENLGKWDQFIFGWDDYVRPDDHEGYTPTGDRDPDLLQPWVSRNREAYRVMRGESNDAYKKRDRWLYVNIGLRLFSVFQVAYLQGMLGGGSDSALEVGGHTVSFAAVPMGARRGAVSASVSF